MATSEIDEAIDRLFAVPPADFVRQRNALAKALKAAGRRNEAAAIEKLARPTLSVWAVNQLARHVPVLVRRLAEATERLQSGGDSNYGAALALHREALKALRAKAEELLEASALRATPELFTRIVHDLRAGLLDPNTRPRIESGRLERDVADEGAVNPFDQELPARAGSASAPAPDPAAQREAARVEEEARAARRRRIDRLWEEAQAAQAARTRDEHAVDAARAALADAEARLARSQAAVVRADAALADETDEAGTPNAST